MSSVDARGALFRGVLLVCGLLYTSGPAFAESEVRGLAVGGTALVRGGLERLGPRLAVRLAESAPSGAALGRALGEALAGSPLAEVYPRNEAGIRALFVGVGGINTHGRTLLRWLERARFHAIEVAVPAVANAVVEAPTIASGLVSEAWEASRGADDRLAATVDELSRRVVAGDITGLLRVERELSEALAQLARAWRPRPRVSAVHADDKGRYLSPDTLWRDAAGDEAAVAEALAAAGRGELESWLEQNQPRHPQYQALVDATERYAARCAAGGFTAVRLPKGKSDPEAIALLQRRLAEEGFYGGEPTGTLDAATEAAVATARRVRHLKEKGGIDAALVASLSVSCDERLATLVLNVRRWRYSAWNGEPERVEVNLAAQLVRYFRDGSLVMKQRTVVGSDKSFFSKAEGKRVWRNSSPILHDSISMVVVNPEWNVPPRIARDEIEPEIEKDPEYLTKKGFRVVETGGGNIYIQGSGPGNALGRVKILFPNSESVYLHDTPGRAAFKLPVRALSHGCVRVENALEFAGELVRADRAKRGEVFDPERIKGITQVTTRTWPFTIEQPIQVFLEYYTASVDEDGVIWFHPDIYGYDAETAALAR